MQEKLKLAKEAIKFKPEKLKKKKKQKKEKTWRSFSFLFQKSWHTFLAKIMKKLLANFFSEPFQGGFMSNLKI